MAQGGTEPTVTDANLVLGYLDKDNFLVARTSSTETAPLALSQAGGFSRSSRHGRRGGRASPGQCAHGRRHPHRHRATRRDPRHFTLLAFVGAAGLHASAVAREPGCSALPCRSSPRAFGLGHAAHRPPHEMARSELASGGVPRMLCCAPSGPGLEAEGRARVASWFGGEVRNKARRRYALWRTGLRDLPCRSRRSSGTRQV